MTEGVEEYNDDSPAWKLDEVDENTDHSRTLFLSSDYTSNPMHTSPSMNGESPMSDASTVPVYDAPSPSLVSPLPPNLFPLITQHQKHEDRMKREMERTRELLHHIWYQSERNDALIANRQQIELVLPDIRLQRMRSENLVLFRGLQVLKGEGVRQEEEQAERAHQVQLMAAENDRLEAEIEGMEREMWERIERLHRQ